MYNVSGAGLIAVEVDGRDVTDLNGCFESSLVVVGNAQTSVNVIHGLMEWPGGSLEQVHLPYRGSGFVCTSSFEARVDGLTATFAADRRGLVPQFQRPKPRGKPMPAHIARGNATRSRVRAKVEHVFAAEKRRFNLVVRTVGLDRATAKIALANLAYNFTRLAWLERRPAPA